jgi:hypothetical protein
MEGLVLEFINLMQVSEKLGFKKKDKEYWGCDELESEFVETKCEIEMMKRNNQVILEEIVKQENVIKVKIVSKIFLRHLTKKLRRRNGK